MIAKGEPHRAQVQLTGFNMPFALLAGEVFNVEEFPT